MPAPTAPGEDFDVLTAASAAATTTGARILLLERSTQIAATCLVAAAPSSKYSQALLATGGDPNPLFLETAARLNRELRQAGGGVIVLLPPLIPGLEDLLGKAPHSAVPLQRLKKTLAAWSERERIALLDAGRSERVGCPPLEFLDEHHAMRECYQKIFDRFWREQGAVDD